MHETCPLISDVVVVAVVSVHVGFGTSVIGTSVIATTASLITFKNCNKSKQTVTNGGPPIECTLAPTVTKKR